MTTDKEETGPRGFSHFIATLAEGDAHAELSAELQELVLATRRESGSRKRRIKGTLTLTISIEADDNGTAIVGYEIKSKHPAPRRPATMLWTTDKGHFARADPRQTVLGLKEVTTPKLEAKEV